MSVNQLCSEPSDVATAAGAPLTAIMMLIRLHERYGWDTEDPDRAVRDMLRAWGTVAGSRRPGQSRVPETFRGG